MRILQNVAPTPEQLTLLGDRRPGVMLIRGAAGSGKTTTALMRLRQLCEFWRSRKEALQIDEPVRVLVLTFNTTLKGYIENLAEVQIQSGADLELKICTFAKFARDLFSGSPSLEPNGCDLLLRGLCRKFGGDLDFVVDEVEYVLGRLAPNSLADYLDLERRGRGIAPRAEAPWRQRLLDEVLIPYQVAKRELNWADWNDLAVAAGSAPGMSWDVVVIDETQDFSANQLRAVMHHVADDHQVTFVMDTTQQIYARYFSWREVGVTVTSTHTLATNYRNTREIAAFARPLVDGLPADDNGALPNFTAASRSGALPVVLSGIYSAQLDWVIENVVGPAIGAQESVAFLQPRGGAWFNAIKTGLSAASVDWVELTRQGEWPTGAEQVAVSTLHSAKGLEFDHVVMLGMNQSVTPHGTETGDVQLDSLRRLAAMGVGRARVSVTLGYKPGEESSLISYLDPTTYRAVQV